MHRTRFASTGSCCLSNIRRGGGLMKTPADQDQGSLGGRLLGVGSSLTPLREGAVTLLTTEPTHVWTLPMSIYRQLIRAVGDNLGSAVGTSVDAPAPVSLPDAVSQLSSTRQSAFGSSSFSSPRDVASAVYHGPAASGANSTQGAGPLFTSPTHRPLPLRAALESEIQQSASPAERLPGSVGGISPAGDSPAPLSPVSKSMDTSSWAQARRGSFDEGPTLSSSPVPMPLLARRRSLHGSLSHGRQSPTSSIGSGQQQPGSPRVSPRALKALARPPVSWPEESKCGRGALGDSLGWGRVILIPVFQFVHHIFSSVLRLGRGACVEQERGRQVRTRVAAVLTTRTASTLSYEI